MNILIPILIVAGIGLIAGIVLSVASIIMAVPVDEKAEKIREVLPGANCGACGFSGCDGYAAALSKGEAATNLCAPGGGDTQNAISEVLGVSSVEMVAKTAFVHCLGNCDNTKDKMIYRGVETCAAANQLHGGKGACSFGCLGFGDCIKACEYDAIKICNGIAVIDPKKCKACSKCVAKCPKNIISITPTKRKAVVRCSSLDKALDVRKACTAGCIGCMLCQKKCETGAITVTNFLASVDPDKCTGCGECVSVCKAKCIDILDF